MKIINTNIENEYLVATIESDPAIFDKYFYRYFEHARVNVKVSGFRRGKVPFDVAKRYVDFEDINKKTFNAIVNATLANIKKTKQLNELEVFEEVVKNEVVDFKQEEKIVIFKSHFETKPEVVLSDFSKIETVFEPYDLNKLFLLVPTEKLDDKTVIYLQLEAYTKEREPIFKYCHEHLQIDLVETKIRKEIVDEIKSTKLNDIKRFTLTIDGKEIDFACKVLSYFEKKELNETTLKDFKNDEIKTLDDLKAFQKDNFVKYNEEFMKNIVVKWANKTENKLSHIPTHNISVESRKSLDHYLNTSGKQYAKDTKLHQKFFENIFYDNLSKIKIACVLEKVAKQLDVKVDKNDEEEILKKFESNNELKTLLTDNESQKDELIKSIIQQEKSIEILKKNIIFSS